MKSMRIMKSVAALALLALPAMAQVARYQDIKTPPLRTFTIAQPKRIELPNGMVILLQEDRELPLIRGTFTIRGGARDVPAEKTGLASIYGQAWRLGGTTAKSGDELDDFLEARAARVETAAGTDSAYVSMDVLKGDFDTVFPIVVDLLEHPAFRQDKIDLMKLQAGTGIARRNDSPGPIAARETNKLGYGINSPYARQAEYATIAAITRDDLVALHDRFVHPNNIIVGFEGDFDSAKLEATLRKTFGSWPRGTQAPKVSPEAFVTPAKPGIYFVAKDDVTQANIAIVHAGTTRNNPDFYALTVMNEILSGGFSGRLMSHIRSDKGLAYGVGGGVGMGWDHPGLFRVQMGTKSTTTVEAIHALNTELADLRTNPITPDELQRAKDSLLNSFVFANDSKSKVLNQRVELELYGYPADWYQRYAANIEKVTTADVERVAKKYVSPDKVAVLVVGREKDFDKPLSTIGPVQTIDVTIPPPPAK